MKESVEFNEATWWARASWERVGLVWLLVGVALVHVPSLFSPFFIDDYVYITTVQDLNTEQVVNILTTSTMGEEAAGVWWTPEGILPFYRPVGELTFAFDHALWGLRPFGYHLTNLALHLICTALVWRLARRFFAEPGWAVVVATVFAIHPVHNEAVAWISGRFDLLVTVCVLASVLSYLNARTTERWGTWWYLQSLFWYVLALGCKETALILPTVLVALELGHRHDNRTDFRIGMLVARLAGFATVAGLYVAMRFAMFGGLGRLPAPYGLDVSQPLVAAGMASWSLLQYVLDFVLFVQVDAFFIAALWLSNPIVLALCTTLALGVIVATALLARSTRAFVVGGVWTLLLTAPALMAMPGERNVYPASVGVALMIAAGFRAIMVRAGNRRRALRWVRGSAVAVLILWIALAQVEWGIMWCVASAGEKIYRDIEAALPDPPENTRIYVVNQCPLSAVGFDQALRLRYGRRDISGCALSLSPSLEVSTTDRIMQTGPRSIRVVRDGGLMFQSAVERFHLFSMPVEDLPDGGRRWGLRLLDPPASFEDVTGLHFEFSRDLTDQRLRLFVWDNRSIQTWKDYPRLSISTTLRPFKPEDWPEPSSP